jgi:hypothetical protein
MTQNTTQKIATSAKGSYSQHDCHIWLIRDVEMSLEALIAGLSLLPQQAQGLITALTKSSEEESLPELEDLPASGTTTASAHNTAAHNTASATTPSISTRDTAYDSASGKVPFISGTETVHTCSAHALPAHNLDNRVVDTQHHLEPATLDTVQWKEEVLLLREDLRRAIIAMNSMAKTDSYPLGSYPLGYHVPLPTDRGPFYAVT